MPLKTELNAVTKMYVKLSKLPVKDMLPALTVADVITDRQREQMNAMTLDKDRASYLLDSVIIPSLKLDIHDVFDAFLHVLEEDDSPIIKRLYEDLKSYLELSLSQPSPAHPPKVSQYPQGQPQQLPFEQSHPYRQSPQGQFPYGQSPQGHFPYGQHPQRQFPYGQSPQVQFPYRQPPQGQFPYGQSLQGQLLYGQTPQGQFSYGQTPQGQLPYGQPPYMQSQQHLYGQAQQLSYDQACYQNGQPQSQPYPHQLSACTTNSSKNAPLQVSHANDTRQLLPDENVMYQTEPAKSELPMEISTRAQQDSTKCPLHEEVPEDQQNSTNYPPQAKIGEIQDNSTNQEELSKRQDLSPLTEIQNYSTNQEEIQENLPQICEVQDNSTNQEEISKIPENVPPQAEIRDNSTNQEEISKMQENVPPQAEIRDNSTNQVTQENVPPQAEIRGNSTNQEEISETQENPSPQAEIRDNSTNQEEMSETQENPSPQAESQDNSTNQEEISETQENAPPKAESRDNSTNQEEISEIQENPPPKAKSQDNSTNQEEISETQENLPPQVKSRNNSTNQEEISKIQENVPPQEGICGIKEDCTNDLPQKEIPVMQQSLDINPPQGEIISSEEDHENCPSQDEIDGSQETHLSQEEIPKVPLCPSPEDNIINVQHAHADNPPPVTAVQQSLNNNPSQGEINGSQEDHSLKEIPKVQLSPPLDNDIISGLTDHDPPQEETTPAEQNSINNVPHKENPKKRPSQEDIIDFWDSTTDRPPVEEIPEILQSITESTEVIITDVQENLTALQDEIDMHQQNPRSNSPNLVREVQPPPVSHLPQGNNPDNLSVQPQALKSDKDTAGAIKGKELLTGAGSREAVEWIECMKSVCRIESKRKGTGVIGYFIVDGSFQYVLLTCNHVIPTEEDAKCAMFYFGYTDVAKETRGYQGSSILDTTGQWFWSDPTYRDGKKKYGLNYSMMKAKKSELDKVKFSGTSRLMNIRGVDLNTGDVCVELEDSVVLMAQVPQLKVTYGNCTENPSTAVMKYSIASEQGSGGGPVFKQDAAGKLVAMVAIHNGYSETKTHNINRYMNYGVRLLQIINHRNGKHSLPMPPSGFTYKQE